MYLHKDWNFAPQNYINVNILPAVAYLLAIALMPIADSSFNAHRTVTWKKKHRWVLVNDFVVFYPKLIFPKFTFSTIYFNFTVRVFAAMCFICCSHGIWITSSLQASVSPTTAANWQPQKQNGVTVGETLLRDTTTRKNKTHRKD